MWFFIIVIFILIGAMYLLAPTVTSFVLVILEHGISILILLAIAIGAYLYFRELKISSRLKTIAWITFALETFVAIIVLFMLLGNLFL